MGPSLARLRRPSSLETLPVSAAIPPPIVSLNLKRRHLDERQRALVAAKIANMRSSTRTDLEPPANLPQESCELDHVLHPERMIAWRCQTTGFDHARHTQLPLPRILPCPPRRNAKTASSGLG